MKFSTTKNIIGQDLITVSASILEIKGTEDVNQENFFDCTVANWKKTNIDFKADYVSESGSEYMYTSEGVYRKSNHWYNFTASCVWQLEGQESEESCIGFCQWSKFSKYSTKRDYMRRTYQENIVKMITGEFAKIHMIGEIRKTIN